MPALLTFLLLAGLAYAAVVGLLALNQRRLLYRPAADACDPAEAGVPSMRVVRQAAALLGWYDPPADGQAPVLVFFHGNCGTLGRVAAKMAPWRTLGIGLFAATYRGYEGNPGRPDEAGLYQDARAVLDWLATQGIPAGRVILYGESLGSGVAAQLAVERPIRGLVLEAPYSSMPEAAAYHYPWTPARLVVRDRYDTFSKIGRIAAPLLILHGSADRTVPVEHGRRLAAAAGSRARLVEIPGAGHLDLFEKGATAPFISFIAELATPRQSLQPT